MDRPLGRRRLQTHRQAPFGYNGWMSVESTQIAELILLQLAGGEKRILSLIVAVRRAAGSSACARGNLRERVASALRKLIASKEIIDADGLYSLSPAK